MEAILCFIMRAGGFYFQPAKFEQAITNQRLLTRRESHIDGTAVAIILCLQVLIAHHIFINQKHRGLQDKHNIELLMVTIEFVYLTPCETG
jgi:hypothetical protein